MSARDGGTRETLDVGGRVLVVSNADKVLYPAAGFTKRDLVAWYRAAAPALLPHLADHALTLGRWPDGVDAPGWFQSNCRGAPPWLRTVTVAGRRGQPLRYCVVEDVAGLSWVANLGTLELHPSLATVSRPDAAPVLLFDLDPGDGRGLCDCGRVAVAIRDELAARDLVALVKTSGQKGLHVVVPLDGSASFAATKPFARALAERLAARQPDAITARMPIAGRAGRVFIDWGQNDAAKQTVAPWSLRATRVPLVSTPLDWRELEAAIAAGDDARLCFSPAAALARLEADAARWSAVLTLRQALPPALH